MTPAKTLRLAIHAWLASRIPSSIVQIIAAFQGNSVTQVQRAVYLMADHGNLISTGERKGARYSAARKRYKIEVRKTAKESGRYEQAALVVKTKSAEKVMDDITANLAAEKAETEPDPEPKQGTKPGSYVHIGGKRTDLKNQRGQGAIPPSARRGCSLGKF